MEDGVNVAKGFNMDAQTQYLFNQLKEELAHVRRELVETRHELNMLRGEFKIGTDRVCGQLTNQFNVQYASLAKEIHIMRDETLAKLKGGE